jgi:uncharacterized protein (DUF1499 family)
MKLFGIAIVSLLIAAALFFLFLGYKSSRMDAPDLIDGQLPACGPKPNCVSSKASTDSEYFVEPLAVNGGDIASRLVAAVEQTGGVVRMQTGGALQATYTSGLFRYVDDVQLVWEAGAATIDVRSASRVGHSDMGANRKRVERLRAALNSTNG